MPSLHEILAQDDRFRRQLLGLPEEDPLAAPSPAAMPAAPPTETPAVGGPAPEPVATLEPMDFELAPQGSAPAFEPEALPAPEPTPAPEPDVAPIGEPLAGGESVDVPPDVVDAPPPPAPEPEDPLTAAVTALLARHGRGRSTTPEKPEDPVRSGMGRVSQALYHAASRTPLPDSYFAREQRDLRKDSKAGRDLAPLAMLRFLADERERKWSHGYKESGEEARQQAKAYDQILRARGLATGERRVTQADEHFDTKTRQKEAQFQVATRLKELGMDAKQAEEQSKRLDKYRSETEDLQAADAALAQINELIPGGIPDSGPEIDALVKSREGFGIVDRIKDRLPGGIGSWLAQPDNAKALRIAYGNLQDVVRHPITGSNFTKGEMENMSRQFGDRLLEDPRAMYLAIQYFRAVTARKLQQKEASVRLSVSPVTWQMYEQMGGMSSRGPLYGRKTEIDNVEDPTKSPIRNTTTGNVPEASGATRDAKGDLRSAPAAPEDRGVKVNVPVSEPDGTTVDPYAATAKPAGDGYRRVYEPSAKRTAVIDAEGNLVDYEDGDTRKTGGR